MRAIYIFLITCFLTNLAFSANTAVELQAELQLEDFTHHGYLVHVGNVQVAHREGCSCVKTINSSDGTPLQTILPSVIDPQCRLKVTARESISTYWCLGGSVSASEFYSNNNTVVLTRRILPERIISMCAGEVIVPGDYELGDGDIVLAITDGRHFKYCFSANEISETVAVTNDTYEETHPVSRKHIYCNPFNILKDICNSRRIELHHYDFPHEPKELVDNILKKRGALRVLRTRIEWWDHRDPFHFALGDTPFQLAAGGFRRFYRTYPHISDGYELFSANGIGSILRIVTNFVDGTYEYGVSSKLYHHLHQQLVATINNWYDHHKLDKVHLKIPAALHKKPRENSAFRLALETSLAVSPEIYRQTFSGLNGLALVSSTEQKLMDQIRKLIENHLVTGNHEDTPTLKADIFKALPKHSCMRDMGFTIYCRCMGLSMLNGHDDKEQELHDFFGITRETKKDLLEDAAAMFSKTAAT